MELTTAGGNGIEQLRDIVGPEISRRQLRDLLERSGGSVQGAVDLHFGAADSSGGVLEEVLDQDAGPSTNASPRSTRRVATGDVASPRHLADYVELSSSTDNDFDPSRSNAALSVLRQHVLCTTTTSQSSKCLRCPRAK